MKALVIYESFWGNTKAIAEAVAEGLGGASAVDVSDVGELRWDELDLVVVGGPTHAFSMSRPSTRRDAHTQGASGGPDERGLREWLSALPDDLPVPLATFDTRVVKVRNLPGSAAKAAGKELRRRHHGRVIDRCSFYVEDSAGPLTNGELERAVAWGTQLAATAAAVG
jgi:hypothetical protein